MTVFDVLEASPTYGIRGDKRGNKGDIVIKEQAFKERVHKNKKTSENIESYPLILPSGFILTKNVFINSYSISGQNMVHIQGSVSTHPVVCNNTSRGL